MRLQEHLDFGVGRRARAQQPKQEFKWFHRGTIPVADSPFAMLVFQWRTLPDFAQHTGHTVQNGFQFLMIKLFNEMLFAPDGVGKNTKRVDFPVRHEIR